MLNPFLNSERHLRNGWWIFIFFLVLAAILAPLLVVARQNGTEVSINQQALVVVAASLIAQLLRRRPITELVGRFDRNWPWQFFWGCLLGSGIMLLPALILRIFGLVDLQWNSAGVSSLISNIILFAGIAIAEELIFRGFIFQRLIDGLGQWPAQLLLAGYFLLTHTSNPGMTGGVKILAGVNIFIASMMFGIAFIRTRSLAMPIGLHFMANWVQGGLLGFGVSGNNQNGLLSPTFVAGPDWLTGSGFGLEASVPELLCVVAVTIALYLWTPSKSASFSPETGNGSTPNASEF